MNERNYDLHMGDSKDILKKLAPNSIESMVTDPPGGINYLNYEWDSDLSGSDIWIEWLSSIMRESHRVLKPGAHAFVWAHPKTIHWTAQAIEKAGFKIRDILTHAYSNGYPKGLSIEKALKNNKIRPIEEIYQVTSWIRKRKIELGLSNRKIDTFTGVKGGASHWTAVSPSKQATIPTPTRWKKLKQLLGEPPEEIKRLIEQREKVSKSNNSLNGIKNWQGWHTKLKPACEYWYLVQKPITEINIAQNILNYGTGALNIDASRVSSNNLPAKMLNPDFRSGKLFYNPLTRSSVEYAPNPLGRFPSNLVLSTNQKGSTQKYFKEFKLKEKVFYCPRSHKSEKEKYNKHPTVKPIKLMKYLVNLITSPNGTVLDPFMGSGTTGVAAIRSNFKFVGIEISKEYFQIAYDRIANS